MNPTGKIELLAPAKNAEIGMAAINHGADAVYIGAQQFSARAAAGNSITEIARLVAYAHRFYARVFVALNTILNDSELAETEKLIQQLYEVGTDALIVQDMGILELNLPPISLHASTQCDNRTLEKVQFLEKCGFEQVVLARELSLEQIKTIAKNTNVALECFIHGALCVSYSGQCYASEALKNRSANRGVCAQICRLPFDLLDGEGKILMENKHLLSLKDFNASAHLKAMIDAGVSSLKIEGRLKDEDYVKNITAFYRQKLDAILEQSNYVKASSGRTFLFFEPNPQKTFNRGTSDYFLVQRNRDLIEPNTPKSVGEPIGKLTKIAPNFLEIEKGEQIHNGDGLCCTDKTGVFVGFRANRVENGRIFPLKMPPLLPLGTTIFRNFDNEFSAILEREKSAERKICVKICVKESENGFLVEAADEDGNVAKIVKNCEKNEAKNAEKAKQTFREQFAKLGNTIFKLADFSMKTDKIWFVPVSQIAEWRRELMAELERVRIENFPKKKSTLPPTNQPFIVKNLNCNYNVFNQKAVDFYRKHGVEAIAPAFEAQHQENEPIMNTKYCLKYHFGWCPKQKSPQKIAPKEPLYLINGSDRLLLQFDCKNCEMKVYKC